MFSKRAFVYRAPHAGGSNVFDGQNHIGELLHLVNQIRQDWHTQYI